MKHKTLKKANILAAKIPQLEKELKDLLELIKNLESRKDKEEITIGDSGIGWASVYRTETLIFLRKMRGIRAKILDNTRKEFDNL